MSLEHTTEKMALMSGAFRQVAFAQNNLPESCLNQRAFSLRHEVNLALRANLDSWSLISSTTKFIPITIMNTNRFHGE